MADYPFTTVEPVLGTLDLDDRQIVIADIPGLIEGAAEGAGLGHEFLAHVERCRLLVHLVEHRSRREGDPEPRTYETVRAELAGYGARARPAAGDRRPLQVATCCPRTACRAARRRVAASGSAMRVAEVLAISSATGAGLDELRRAILARTCPSEPAAPPRRTGPSSRPSTVSTGRARTRGSRSSPRGRGAGGSPAAGSRCSSRATTSRNPEALDYLEQRLREIGVIAELQRAGFERGDEVVVGEVEFELDPA